MAPHVFISHSSQNQDVAHTVCQFLEAHGITCWIAPRNVPPGAKYGEAILHAIEEALAIVFLFSAQSNTSEQVMNEIERAVSKKKPIFPLKLSPITPSAELEYFISRRHWLDLTAIPLDTALQQLSAALHALAIPEPLLVLEVAREGERLKLSAYERSTDKERPLRHYEYRDVSFVDVERVVDNLVTLLYQATQNGGRLQGATWQEVQASGALLYRQLLSPSMQERLKQSTATHCLLHINDGLMHIPWELLYDGDTFLCRRFSLGRSVSAHQTLVEHQGRQPSQRLTMRIIADPQGNLAAAAREGQSLRQELNATGRGLQVYLHTTTVDIAAVTDALTRSDVLHYAGYADYNPQEPAQSGWLLADGKLTAAEILRLGGQGPMPAVVFCNACQSGQTTARKMTQEVGQGIYDLVNAFLRAGVQHYIGSLWEIPAEPEHTFAIEFYHALARGASIGAALRIARQQLVDRSGEDSVVWASYVLYGDPTSRYLATTPEQPTLPQEEAPLRTVLRGENPPHSRRTTLLLAGASIMVIFLGVLAALMGPWHRSTPMPEALSLSQSYQALAQGGLTQTEKEARIDQLVRELLQAHKEGKGLGNPGDGWTSIPLILAFLRSTFEPKAEDEALLNSMEQALRETGRFTIIERELLEKLLAELKLSTTALVDRQAALHLGKILGATLLAAGRIHHSGAEGSVTVRLIDTETSKIPASTTASFKVSDTVDSIASSLAQTLLRDLRKDSRYLRQGHIARVTPTILLNIGAEQGVTRNLVLEVVEPVEINGKIEYFSRDDVGRLQVTAVQTRSSQAEPLQAGRPFQPGWKVREVVNP